MKNLAVELEVIVLGREIFTDLWRLFGFKAVICEDPNNVYAIWKELISENVAVIIVEDNWFSEMPLRPVSYTHLTAYAQAKIGSAGAATIAEKPETAAMMIILEALPETMVILGFVVAIMLILQFA